MMDVKELKLLISHGESITQEFKSDKSCLPDKDLIAAIVSLANTDGGLLFLGVEDSGEITGICHKHQEHTMLKPFIASRTNPSIDTKVYLVNVENNLDVIVVEVQKSNQLISTSEGLIQRRRLKLDGTPEAVPFYPHEFIQRQSTLGLIDPSATIISDLSVEEFSSVERERVREAIRKYGGDQSLLSLNDSELDGALGFSYLSNGIRKPTFSGVLFLCKEHILRQYIPSYEIAFQVLDGTDVRINEFFRKPFLQSFEEIEQLFRAQLVEKEVEVGLFRVAVPNFNKRAFREAFVNALIHRDYSRLGAVHVRIDDYGLTISSPGGFVEGVTLDNLLVTEPRPRNPLLADIAKRIGVAERTGRGIDRIYEGVLRYGREIPSFSRSSSTSVVLQISNAEADFEFLKLILSEEEKTQKAMPLDSLIVLSQLRKERRVTTHELMKLIQKNESEIRSILEKLSETGLLEAHGSGRGRTFTLSAKMYTKEGSKAAYIRQAGFEPLQQEQMILSYIDKHGAIKRNEVADLCRLSPFQATRLLTRLKTDNKIIPKGKGKGTFYERCT